MKVAAATLKGIMGLMAHSQGEKKTITLTPGENTVTLVTASGAGSTRARILAVTEDDDLQACALPAPLLQALAGTATAEIITLSPTGAANQIAANTGASNTSLSTGEPLDFPALDPATAPEERTTFSVPVAVLAAGVGRVLHAASKETTNLAYSMIQFVITADGNLVTAALNGNRLAFSRTAIPDWSGEPVTLLFPRTRQLDQLLELAPEATAHIMVANDKILIAVKTEALGIEVVLNTADIPYPDWRKPLDAMGKPTIVATVKTKAMRDLMARAAAICPTQRVGIKLNGARLILGAKSETVQHVDFVELDDIKGLDGEFNIFTNPTLISDALNAVNTWTTADTVRLGFIAANKPIVIAAVGYAYSNYIWPMATREPSGTP